MTASIDTRLPSARGRAFARVDALAGLLDDSFRIPGTQTRIGLDPIIGLLPGVGDGITSILSAVIIYEAAQMGVPKRHLLLMLGNVALDGLIGSVPILGDIFDFAFRANRRNVELLQSLPESSFVPPRSPRTIGILVGGFALGVLVLLSFLSIYLLHALFVALS